MAHHNKTLIKKHESETNPKNHIGSLDLVVLFR